MSIGTMILSKFDYTYTAVGNIATKQEQADSSTPTLWTYGYDAADQLDSAVRTNTSTHAIISQYFYGYDKAGNRTTEQIGLGVTPVSYNNLNQVTGSGLAGAMSSAPVQFSGSLDKAGTVSVGGNATPVDADHHFAARVTMSAGTNNVPVVATNMNGYATTNTYQVVIPSGTTTTPAYDANGNTTDSGKGQTYAWDAKDELVGIVYSSGPHSGNHTEFTYDGMGRRVKIVERSGTTLGSGTVASTQQFVWIGNAIAEERDGSNVVTKRFYAQGEQIGGTNYYYTFDHLGSVREMVNNSGTIEARYDYDPYGRATKVSGSLDSDFQYAGMYIHQPSGLNLTKYRAYDSNTGRWLSRDPIAEQGGINLYGYCDNDPTNYIDSQGDFGILVYAIVAAAVAVFIAALVAKNYNAAQQDGTYASTIAGTTITAHNHDPDSYTNYDNLSPTGKKIIDSHECIHQHQPLYYNIPYFVSPGAVEKSAYEDTLQKSQDALDDPQITGKDRKDAESLHQTAQDALDAINGGKDVPHEKVP